MPPYSIIYTSQSTAENRERSERMHNVYKHNEAQISKSSITENEICSFGRS